MLSCKEVCYIVSEMQDGKSFPLGRRVMLTIHYSMCKGCRQMARQMELLSATAHQFGKSRKPVSSAGQPTLSAEAIARIGKRLVENENSPLDDD